MMFLLFTSGLAVTLLVDALEVPVKCQTTT